VFNLGAGELTVLFLLAVIFLGPHKLPDLAQLLGDRLQEARANVRPRRPTSRDEWSRADWLLVGAVLATGSLALAFAFVRAGAH
jgi:Sec-independent protein translocase protein TatA